jgi:hypothetical protein
VYTIDLVDFYVIPSPFPATPTGYFSVTDFGGDPTGKNDSTLAFQQVIEVAYAKNWGMNLSRGRVGKNRQLDFHIILYHNTIGVALFTKFS